MASSEGSESKGPGWRQVRLRLTLFKSLTVPRPRETLVQATLFRKLRASMLTVPPDSAPGPEHARAGLCGSIAGPVGRR